MDDQTRNITWIGIAIIVILCILASFNVFADCSESWQPQYGVCNESLRLLTYYDINECNTSIALPDDNNSFVACECFEDWHETMSNCSDNKQTKTYIDTNDCGTTSLLPSDDNKVFYCDMPTTDNTQITINEGVIVLIILFIFILISIWCALQITSSFFFATALFSLLGAVSSWYYQYPDVVTVCFSIFVILFVVVGFFMNKKSSNG